MANRGTQYNPYRPRLVEEGIPIQEGPRNLNHPLIESQGLPMAHHAYKSSSSIQYRQRGRLESNGTSEKKTLQSLAKKHDRYRGPKTLSYSSHLTIGGFPESSSNEQDKVEHNRRNPPMMKNSSAFHHCSTSSQTYAISNDSEIFQDNENSQQSIDLSDDKENPMMEVDEPEIDFYPKNTFQNTSLHHRYQQFSHNTHTSDSFIETVDSNHHRAQNNQHLLQSQSQLQSQLQFGTDEMYSDDMDIDHAPPQPLIVIDGANVAYAYADAMQGGNSYSDSALSVSKSEPNVMGIDLTVQYFLKLGVRVIVVLPAQWMRKKPHPKDLQQENAMMQTSELDTLTKLKVQGLLCLSPPTDDDDAYIIDIARKADLAYSKSNQRNKIGGGYILSCDMYRDAIQRDRFQNKPSNTLQRNLGEWMKRKRISYTFYRNENGYNIEQEGTFVPNPRNELIASLSHTE